MRETEEPGLHTNPWDERPFPVQYSEEDLAAAPGETPGASGPEAAVAAYWRRAQHCCDPDECAAEVIRLIEDAGYVIEVAR